VSSRLAIALAGSLVLFGCRSGGATRAVAPGAVAPRSDLGRPAPETASPPESPPDRATEQAWLRSRYAGKPALKVLRGEATWYADSLAGRRTASGEPYDPAGFTAAHPWLPLGTILRVRVAETNDWVYVRINDRGPVGHQGRILDLSRRAADDLGRRRAGVFQVHAEVVQYGAKRRPTRQRRRTR
jgi:rare lipoprotein A